MLNSIFRVCKKDEYRKAGPSDLIELLAIPGNHSLFILKRVLETLICGIVNAEFIHLSGPTGSAKSSLIEALYLETKNFNAICRALGFSLLPLKIYPIEMATYETPGELYQRRALKDGTTFDEKSSLVKALEDAAMSKGKCYPVIWLREMGRVHTSSVQGGLLNLMTKDDIVLSDGTRFSGQGIAWIADSNYQAEEDSTHTLVTLDDALKRRFTINLTLDYLSAEQEVHVLKRIINENKKKNKKEYNDLIAKVVRLGKVIRQQRLEGNFQSLPPPTIWGYAAYLRMAQTLPQHSPQQIAKATLLGNASSNDRKLIPGLVNTVFGFQRTAQEDDPTMRGNLF
ncbi:MAG: hypothetical protein ACMUJM_25805 [bacterium]